MDYYARVWVNGHLLGEHEGMLGGPTADIQRWVNAQGKNDLVVEVKAANWGLKASYEPRNPKTVMKPWSFAGGTSGEAFFPFGIWRPVRIELTGPLHLERPQLVTESISPKSAKLRLSVEIGAGTSPITGTLHRLESSRNMVFSNAWTAKPVPGSHTVEVIFAGRK